MTLRKLYDEGSFIVKNNQGEVWNLDDLFSEYQHEEISMHDDIDNYEYWKE